jgi:hypothetical protein
MRNRHDFIEQRRAEAWALGIEHREYLVARYLAENGLRERPLLHEIIDDLIEEVQQARLREDVPLLDRFAQSEVVDGRVEVTINSRIGEMSNVKYVDGIIYVAKWHESIHVARDMDVGESERRRLQPFLPGLDAGYPRQIACRWADGRRRPLPAIEFIAENAAVAVAIAGSDLARCPSFDEFRRLAVRGGDMRGRGWHLLYETAAFIGVNPTVLVRYLEQRGVVRVEVEDERRRLIAAPQFEGGMAWL